MSKSKSKSKSSAPEVYKGEKLVAANSKFAHELYLRQAASTSGNVFISPLSISVSLAMAYLGARNDTKAQMKDVMNLGEVDDDQVNDIFEDVLAQLNKPNPALTIYMANRLFGEQRRMFRDNFQNLCRKHYGAELAPVDFVGDGNGAAAEINNWVAENTNQMIRGILPPDAITSRTRLVLVNTIFFQGNWAEQFDRSLTHPADFHVSPTETIKVDMMHSSKITYWSGHNEDLACQALVLRYSGKMVNMFIILPDPSTTLADVEKKLPVQYLSDAPCLFDMHPREMDDVWIPRFRLVEKLELSDTLTQMGMTDAFTDGRADFSGLDGTNELHVSKVLHQAVIDVNEEGTMAAGTNADGGWLCGPEHIVFRADRPFLFFIRHIATKSVVFIGRVVRPSPSTSSQ